MWFEDLRKEFTDPYDKKNNFYLRLEAMARYLFCKDFIKDKGIDEVVDIGFANGYGCEIMAGAAYHVYGTETRDDLADDAKENLVKNNVNNVTYFPKEISIEKGALPEKKYDLITCIQTLAYIENPEKALENIYNSLNDGGYLIVAVPNAKFEPILANGKSAYKNRLHSFSFNQAEKLIKDKGFKILEKFGQALTVKLLNREFEIIDSYDFSEKAIKNYLKQDRDALEFFSRLLAYPVKGECQKSNSIIFVCQK